MKMQKGDADLGRIVDGVLRATRLEKRARTIQRHWRRWPTLSHADKLAVLRDAELRAELKRR